MQERRYYTNLSLFYTVDSHSCLPKEINHIPYKTVILEKCERVGVGKSVYQARYNFISIFHEFIFILKYLFAYFSYSLCCVCINLYKLLVDNITDPIVLMITLLQQFFLNILW